MSFFRKAQTSDFLSAVADLERGVRDQDSARSERAFAAVSGSFQTSSTADATAAGPRLAALLPQFPAAGPRGILAVIVGACVERGADAAACAAPLLGAADEAVRDALVFALAWSRADDGDNDGEDDFPNPEEDPLDEAVIDRLAAQIGDPRAAHRAAVAWWSLGQWEMASVAVLSHRDVRRALAPELRRSVVDHVEQLRGLTDHEFKCLYYALLVLEDEDVVVLHRPTGTGYRIRISGLGDNFQLHTLLAHALVGGGHVPGQAPSAEAVAVAVDQEVPQGARLDTTGAFNLMAPDGDWIWNEGTPSDIPVVDGVRLLVLDPPAYERSWNAGRFFPGMPGSLTLTEVLSADETARWFQHVKPAGEPV